MGNQNNSDVRANNIQGGHVYSKKELDMMLSNNWIDLTKESKFTIVKCPCKKTSSRATQPPRTTRSVKSSKSTRQNRSSKSRKSKSSRRSRAAAPQRKTNKSQRRR